MIPGYGHAVLRNTDPRFLHLKGFADKHIKNDYICDLARECFDTIPGILGKVGKIKNPYPNVDAFSGALLQHFGKFDVIQAWFNMISIRLFSGFRGLLVVFQMEFGPAHSDSQLKDQTALT